MAEECVITTFEAPEDISRPRSGSASGSSDSDVSPICKISPLVVPVHSTSPRPLTPKKRHRAEMEQELRRQEEALRAEEAKPTVKEAKSPAVDVKSGGAVETKPEKELPMKKRNSELKEQMASETKTESKDEKPADKGEESETKTASNVESEISSTPKKSKPEGTKPAKSSTTPKKSPAAKSPAAKASVSPGGGADGEVVIPDGWRRIATQRMQGVSAGKVDVYYWSPTGKKFRSRPQILSYLEEVGSPLSVEAFDFRSKNANASPARIRSPAPGKTKKVTPKAKVKESPKKAKTKTKPLGRPRKNSGGKSPAKKTPAKKSQVKKSPAKKSQVKKSPAKKLAKQPRKVMKPPPDTGPKKASRAQQLQKLLVKINFQKPGDIREMSSDESSNVSEDDFDPGTTEEIDNTSEISVTPSPPPTKKMRRHSSPID
ncbi:uncharacterized protein [Asterias amurensis]|uniref:uncharacterized protein n=1 Tax=Asterias amurensis TaxID=7602 RepID=UPI003AB8B2C1